MPVLPSTQTAPPKVSRWVAVLTFAVPTGLLFVFGWKTWAGIPVGVWHDDGAYLLIAESLANGGGLSWFGVSGTPPAAKFPPLFPGVMSLLLRAGVEPESGEAAFALVNLGFLSAAGGLFALFLHRARLFGPLGAGIVASVLWLCPRLWALAALPLSEPLFLLALSAALLASVRFERTLGPQVETNAPSTRAILPGVDFLFAFAAGFYTRTIGIVMGAAMVGACVLRGGYRQAALLAGGSAAIVIPWMVWSASATERIAEPLRDVLGGYGGWLLGEATRDPLTFLRATLTNLWYGWMTLSMLLVPGLPGHPMLRALVGAALLILAFIGMLKLSRRSLTAVLFVVFYLAIVALWPFRTPRLLMPVLPLVGLACGLTLRLPEKPPESDALPWHGPAHRPAWKRMTLALFGMLLVANYGARSAIDVVSGSHLVPYQVRADALQAAVQSIEEFTTAADVVGAPELWAGIQIHSNRVVAPSARFLPLAVDGPSWGTPQQQYQLWDVANLDYIVVEHAGGVHGDALDELDAACPGGAVQLVALLPTGFLVRLAWDAECRARVLP